MWLVGRSNDSFVKRLRADRRCAIGVVDFDVQRGVLRHVGIRGSAEVRPMCGARLERLLCRYLGDDTSAWNRWFVAQIIEPLDVMICITPKSVVANDYSYFKTGPDRPSS